MLAGKNGAGSRQLDEVTWDFNNIVTHGKGFSIVSALEVTMGHDPFERAYARALREYAGRPLGAGQFQAVCENEISGSSGWFLQQWVRSARYLWYGIAGQSSERAGAEIVTSVEVSVTVYTSIGQRLIFYEI